MNRKIRNRKICQLRRESSVIFYENKLMIAEKIKKNSMIRNEIMKYCNIPDIAL